MRTIELRQLEFSYNDKTPVFRGHSLRLDVPIEQTHALYGIIGPSGTGKTTLLSVLGGQLRPGGEVLVNGTDIYQVGDATRRGLLAMQLQTSTSLRGKLRYNLVFGIPLTEDNGPQYSDKELIDVLNKVGLWDLFAGKDGLETLIGEGGLNLSGGQRQRLNFASLYLRAKFFQPSVILIDEPTSSLDEISELAITRMIDELSEIAITLVVAHRLKTLESAVALLDSSLFATTKELRFYSPTELEKNSQYYKDLLSGRAHLEE